MRKISRRKFILNTIAAGASISVTNQLTKASVSSKVRGANDDIRVAVIGLGTNKGAQHVEIFRNLPGVRVVAICDVDQRIMDRELEKFQQRNEKVDGYIDARKILDDKNIDSIVIATPNHWHALLTIWGCQAGKDVYVEKPVSHSIWESEKMVQAARKYKRIVQAGIQRRSCPGMQQVVEYIQQGNLGQVQAIRSVYYGHRKSIGKTYGPQPIPKSVDYNLWTGPARLEPLMRKKLHYDWHWFWSIGNGEVGNNGVHFLDLCRWVLGGDEIPSRVFSIGGRYVWDDDGQTSNTNITIFDYKQGPVMFEQRNLPRSTGDTNMDHCRGIRFGMIVECENGYFAGGMGGGKIYDRNGEAIQKFVGDNGAGHQANFIQAVRSRKITDQNADILQGHLSTIPCHMANISWRTGAVTPQEEIKKTIAGDKAMEEMYDRLTKHLAANGVDLAMTPATLGAILEYDAENMKFRHQDATTELLANALQKDSYRKPFVVPEKV